MALQNNSEKDDLKTDNSFKFDFVLFITIFPVIAATIRIWLYSGGDMVIFLLLLKTLHIPSILIATFVLMIPILVTVIIIVMITDWKARDYVKKLAEQYRWITLIFPLFFFILVYTASPLLLLPLLGIASLALLYIVVDRFWTWGRKNITSVMIAKKGDPNTPDSIITLISTSVVFLIIPYGMWLPLESISTGQNQHYYAYVLESNDQWTTILTPEKNPLIISTSTIESRELCRAGTSSTLAKWLFPHDTTKALSCRDKITPQEYQLPEF